MTPQPAFAEPETAAISRVTLFLAPLLFGYGAASIWSSGVAWPDFQAVFILWCRTAATLAAGIYILGQGIAWLRRKDSLFSAGAFAWLVLGACSLILLLPCFGVFKQLILPGRGFVSDPWLAAAGRIVLGGASPWELTHSMFGSLWSAIAIDKIYTFWSLLLMVFPMIIPFIHRDSRRRAQMLIAWVLCWMLIGTLAAWIFGSAGPCYYNALVGPDANFADLNARLHALAAEARANGFELKNIDFQAQLLAAHHGGRYAAAGGISAMPSMHVTIATLVALAGWTASRPLGHVLSGYAAVIWISSIYLGWHYAVDGPVAVVLTFGVWRLAGWIARQICSVPKESVLQPAPCMA
jgi:hypothetical protein